MAGLFARLKNRITGQRDATDNNLPQNVVVENNYGISKENEGKNSSFYNDLDPIPKFEFYAKDTFTGRIKNTRPSLDVLRKPPDENDLPPPPEEDLTPRPKLVRFSWQLGVLIRCMLNIWGVIMFLRLPWITSQAGIICTWVIIFMSVTVTTITATSVSAISTNGRVKSGGTYFMISRSLGPELGAPIGLLFSFANALACSLNTLGFAETVRDMLKDNKIQMVDPVNDVRIIGAITVVILLLITFGGMSWEAKAQIFFFICLIVSLVNYFVGTVLPPTKEKQSVGFFSYRSEIFIENLLPSFRGPNGNFFRMFAIFFPAATGILSGVNICGDLKDPEGGIPKGTLLAILFTTLSYLLISITSASTVLRDASGIMNDSLVLNATVHCTGLGCKLGWDFDRCEQNRTCPYGLANYFQILTMVSANGYLILIGIFAATLSSALGFLVSAPKIFQCLCKDNIYPYIGFFAKGYGKNNEPLRAYVLTFLIAMAFILVGDLNAIAPLISNFFLCSYGLINFSCFHASVVKSPGWRPAYRYYTPWTSLFGSCLSFLLMFLFTWWAALITFSIFFCLLAYVTLYKKPAVNWGTSYQAGTYNMALTLSAALTSVEDHVKNYRPQCLVLTGPPNTRPALVDFVGTYTKNLSLMICGNILMEDEKSALPQPSTETLVDWLNKRKVRAFYTSLTSDSLKDGTQQLMQASGLGKLRPNTIVMGYKANWQECKPESLEDYVSTIYNAFDSNYGISILRMMEGLDTTLEEEREAGEPLSMVNAGFDAEEGDEEIDDTDRNSDISDCVSDEQAETMFQTKQGRKTIDVYWISDDGGLTLLVPFLLTRRNRWKKSKIRVFLLGSQETLEEDRKDMKLLLKRFRLKIKDIFVITDIDKPPVAKNWQRYQESISPFKLNEDQPGADIQEQRRLSPWKVSSKDLEAMNPKLERTVRLNEIIKRSSINAALVVISLPVPDINCPSSLYMAWLEALSSGIHCPVLLIRGNQQNVMTFYCQ